MGRKPHVKPKGDANKFIIAGIIAAIAIAVGYGAVSGSFSSLTAPAEPHNQKIVMHIHPKIKIMIDGDSVTLPANIGINSALYKNHDLDAYGMKNPRMAALHTHDPDGVIHVESTEMRDFTLGQFFDIWGVQFSETCIMDNCNEGNKMVRMFVDDQPNSEFRNHMLKDGENIVIEYG